MWKRGEITVFISLVLAVLLAFFQVCLQSVRLTSLRSQTQEALELSEISALSEYHRELLERYGLFYLDLGYGSGIESEEYLEGRIRSFLDANMHRGRTKAVEVYDIARASDGRGRAYYEQAVSFMRQRSGAGLLDQLREYGNLGLEGQEAGESYQEADARERANLEELGRRREEEEEEPAPDPMGEAKALRGGSILQLILEDPSVVSGKGMDPERLPSNRTLLLGAGPRGRYDANPGNDLFFLAYLLDRFPQATDYLSGGREPEEWLDYQLEYIIAGKETDIANLESICSRLLLMREGVNYAYLLTDEAKVGECEAMALALVGLTLIPGLVEAVKQALLLAWAFGESVMDVKLLLAGKRCAFAKNGNTWKTSLSEALKPGSLGLPAGEDPQGLLYKDYLGVLLTLCGRETKMMRSLDVIEGVIRRTADNQGFYIDQCTDGFQVRAVIQNGRELSGERWFCYEW